MRAERSEMEIMARFWPNSAPKARASKPLGVGVAYLHRQVGAVSQPFGQLGFVKQQIAERGVKTVHGVGGLRRRVDLASETLFFINPSAS